MISSNLRVNAVAQYQTVEPILTGPAAFLTLDSENCELADQVAEDDRAVAGRRPFNGSPSGLAGPARDAGRCRSTYRSVRRCQG